MRVDLETDTTRAVALCAAAEQRLMETVVSLDHTAMGRDSRLPGWSVGHVLSHLARNADGHARRVAGALRGEDLGKYAGGAEQRSAEIEEGSRRGSEAIIADLAASQERLADLFNRAEAEGWPNATFMGGGSTPVAGCPAHRLREVEMHHVDLGVGYTPQDWPEDYVAWDLEVLVTTLPERLGSAAGRRDFMAWLAGRGPADPTWSLAPWG